LNTISTLQQFGLEEKEAKLYLAALELGTATAKDIAAKGGIQRTYFYDLSQALLNLVLLRQVSSGKKRLFTAAEPEHLIKSQEQRLGDLKNILPQLKAVQNTSGQKPRIYFYNGLEGIAEINNDTLRYQGDVLAFTTPRFVLEQDQKLGKEYIKRRVALGNMAKVIGEDSSAIQHIKKRDAKELRQTRVLPRELYSSEVEIGIYGNKVYMVDYREKFGFIIEGSSIAEVMKKIFGLVWTDSRITK
jgi:HTH-type transcriptional regulator, sugar sensing transcriptional regulator